MTEESCAFYCGTLIAVSVARQVATLMFEEVRRPGFWGAGIFLLTSFLVQQAHDYLGVSWRALYIGSGCYFAITMYVGEYLSRRRTRKHKARMAEFERKEREFIAEFEGMSHKLKGN